MNSLASFTIRKALHRGIAQKVRPLTSGVDLDHYNSGWNIADLGEFTKTGKYQIQTFNKISPKGLARFGDDKYEVKGTEWETNNAHAILLRSHKLQESEVDVSVRAIARCGAGTNNVPVARMTELGIPVFNTPGANANAVKELVLCGMLLGSRRVVDGVNHMKDLGSKGLAKERVEKDKSMFGGQEIMGKTLAVVGLGHIGMYRSKEECCQDMFGWAPLDNCLGEDWVETNYVIGSMSPTMSPSMTPTGTPSLMPSVSFMPSSPPSDIHSDVPSNVPSSAPSNVPSLSPSRITMVPTLTPTTYAPTTLSPTGIPTETIVVVAPPPLENNEDIQAFSSSIEYESEAQSIPATSNEYVGSQPQHSAHDPSSFLVELLGWANADYSSVDYTRPTKTPTKKPTTENFAISEIILPIVEDATISLQRQNLNFGSNSALAVDGGTSSLMPRFRNVRYQ